MRCERLAQARLKDMRHNGPSIYTDGLGNNGGIGQNAAAIGLLEETVLASGSNKKLVCDNIRGEGVLVDYDTYPNSSTSMWVPATDNGIDDSEEILLPNGLSNVQVVELSTNANAAGVTLVARDVDEANTSVALAGGFFLTLAEGAEGAETAIYALPTNNGFVRIATSAAGTLNWRNAGGTIIATFPFVPQVYTNLPVHPGASQFSVTPDTDGIFSLHGIVDFP